MPKVTEEHRAVRRDQILDAALRCFAAHGFQATSMADIIADSGLSAGAIYLYFEGKHDIAVAAARRILGGRASDLLALPEGDAMPGPADLIRAIADGLDRDGISTGLLVQLWGESVTDPVFQGLVEELFAALALQMRDQLRRWGASVRGLASDEAEAWADRVLPAMTALAHGYIVQSALLPDFDSSRYLAAVSSVSA